jgi:hypothetical protein
MWCKVVYVGLRLDAGGFVDVSRKRTHLYVILIWCGVGYVYQNWTDLFDIVMWRKVIYVGLLLLLTKKGEARGLPFSLHLSTLPSA